MLLRGMCTSSEFMAHPEKHDTACCGLSITGLRTVQRLTLTTCLKQPAFVGLMKARERSMSDPLFTETNERCTLYPSPVDASAPAYMEASKVEQVRHRL